MLRQMTEEEMNSLKVGDKVILSNGTPNGFDSFVLVSIGGDEFACLSESISDSFTLDEELIESWKEYNWSVLENWEDYQFPNRFIWVTTLFVRKETETPIKTKPCSCKECKGTGVIKTDFYDRYCGCPIGQSLIG